MTDIKCEECGRAMTQRTIEVPCCGSPYECTDFIDQPFCVECDPPDGGRLSDCGGDLKARERS